MASNIEESGTPGVPDSQIPLAEMTPLPFVGKSNIPIFGILCHAQ